MRTSRVIATFVLASVASVAGLPLRAQGDSSGAIPDPRANICYGVSFGAWTPALDWFAAGHRPPRPPPFGGASARSRAPQASAPRAPAGAGDAGQPSLGGTHAPGGDPAATMPRGDAMHPDAMPDSSVMLFPVWWPAGVRITYLRGKDGATSGKAMALVADARLTPPTAPVRAGRIPCRAP